MGDRYELPGLTCIYNEAIERSEPTLAFNLNNGKGRFLFMMFFSEEDESTKDLLFVFMRNTKRMVKLKLYGNHRRGQFYIYLQDYVKNCFTQELQLGNSNPVNPFNFNTFFGNLSNAIPATVSLQQKIDILRDSWDTVKEKLPDDIVDDNDKTNLVGIIRLPVNKKPREKTLRKLYLYTDANGDDISALIERLKQLNITVAWTNKKSEGNKTVSEILSGL